MTTRRKKWPHWAAWARDDAVMEATEALRDLEPVLLGRTEGVETVRRVGLVVHRLHRIIRVLTEVRDGNSDGV